MDGEADAWSVGVAALTASRLTTAATDEASAVLHALTEHRDDLVRTRTQTANRFHSLLTQLIPSGHPRGLTANDAAEALRSVRPRTPSVRRCGGWQWNSSASCAASTGGLTASASELAGRRRLRHNADDDLRRGTLVAAKLLARTGPVSRFRSGDAFASYAGVAPIEVSSGDVVRHGSPEPATGSSTTPCTSSPSPRSDEIPPAKPTTRPNTPPGRATKKPSGASNDAWPTSSTAP